MGFSVRPGRDEYFQELWSVSAARQSSATALLIFRWTKDDRQDNEALDTMIQATGAALKFGVYGLADTGWARLRLDRETPIGAKPEAAQLQQSLASRLAR